MERTIEAEYIAKENILRLTEPLAGVGDHAKVRITIVEIAPVERGDWPTLGEEAGRELAKAVREAFGRDHVAV